MAGEELSVFLGERMVGTLRDLGALSYVFSYVEGVGRAGRLSNSLPIRASKFLEHEVKPFFEGLLPEERVRQDVARQLGIDPSHSFGLLRAIGSECAGAVTIVPAGEPLPSEAGVEWMSPDELVNRIEGLPSFPLGRDERLRSRASLAGAQRKMVAVVDGERVGVPTGTYASTHLLKPQWRPGPDDPQVTDVVANETFCMRLAKAAGCDVANVEPRLVGERWVLFVERFDRVTSGGRMTRVHQEDIAQAAGKLPSSKYEQDGGIALAAVASTLVSAGVAGVQAQQRLLDAIVVAAAIGNADQHAKNIGVLYATRPKMAPLYDLMSTMVYDDLTRRSAFVVGEELYIDEVDDEACVKAASTWLMPERVARRNVANLTRRLHEAALMVQQQAMSEGWHRPVVDEITQLVMSWPQRARHTQT